MDKYDYSTNTIYYQKARFFRKEGTNEFAYCIEPLRFFKDNSNYEVKENIDSLSEEKLEKIKKIAHFGYQYNNHSEPKWYAITQMMIWQEVGSDYGSYYFTDTLNGNRIDVYQEEINEINNLIAEYNIDPVSNRTFKILENQSMGYYIGGIINNYKIDDEHININNGTIEIKNLTEGYYEFTLTREEENNKPILFYQAQDSQTLMENGDIDNKVSILKIEVNKSNITIHKIDKDTQDNTPQGEAELNGAKYGLYKESNNKLIQEVEINNNEGIIENIGYGKYYLKEISPGTGYTLNEEKYPISITNNEFKKELTVENKVIEKKIIITKRYGEKNNLLGEENITFEIYNSNNQLINSLTTDYEGKAEIILPYGTYVIKQINTTEGYEKIEDYQITINNTEEKTIEFIDYKIAVPNTYTHKKNILEIIVLFIIRLLC